MKTVADTEVQGKIKNCIILTTIEPTSQKLDQKSNDWEVGFFMAKYDFEFKANCDCTYYAIQNQKMLRLT